MVNLRAEYCKEREGIDTYEIPDKGFIEYKFGSRYNKNVCFIKNLYVRPDFRRTKVGTNLARYVESKALEIGIKTMLCCVECGPYTMGQPLSLNSIYSDGYQAIEFDSTQTLWLFKEI